MLNPKVLVIMGVSGSGKSTIAEMLAENLSILFLDADDFHSTAAKQHMASGQPLTNDMRRPWIDAVKRTLSNQVAVNNRCVLAFSGLQRQHRDQLRTISDNLLFIHLTGEQSVISNRVDERSNHFMPSELLASQFQCLESTEDERDVISIDVNQTPKSIVDKAISAINNLN